ncbi:MAG: hypothetical protein E6J91_34925 [Deltaproteobacteria bacterium]|nr:MAG: hypothetical protein E6J91_34925 [Deltaproteobacteria bacterium]
MAGVDIREGRRAGTHRSRWLSAALAVVAVGSTGRAARADDDVDAQLAAFETEVRQLGADLPAPNQSSSATGQRRLLDAEVSYALGDYDAAALMLFELASRPGADRETAAFYLAESLFQKGDRGAARGYYEQVVTGGSVASKYYQPALQRLIEIAILLKDDTGLGEHLAALDRVSPGLRLPSVPYVRGKLAYAQGKYDEALAFFADVPKGTDYEMQAAYYTATTYVAKADLGRATEIFTDLIGRRPRAANDRRIIELSQLALGRLYYERDQQSKSIDSYLLVDRHSDLFPDALYEVSWVYVKAKQYDKALRALELLALSDPQSTKTPTVKILEGNLRVRKAQMIRGAQILGTLDAKEQDDPATEYDRAAAVFTETHDMYVPSYAALSQMVGGSAPAVSYLNQIAGRSEHVFQAAAPVPEAAIQYLRDEPEVQRVVAVEGDLAEISANIAEAAATIARLEGVLAARDRGAVYPALASRRGRVATIEAQLIRIRNDLAEQQLRLVASPGELAGLTGNRRQRFAAFAAMPDPEKAAADHLAQNQARYDAIEQSASEVDTAIGATQAMAVALRKYSIDTPDLPADQGRAITTAFDDAAREANDIENQLAEVRMVGLVTTSRDRGKAQKLAGLGDRAARLAEQLAETTRQIDGVVDGGLKEVRGLLAQEKATLAAYKAELAGHEAESRSIGGSVLAASFKDVKAKFYDIVIRTDVGNVDVAWSQKEDVDDDLKRLNLSRQRELKQLRDEFKDILDAGTTKPSAPKKPARALPPAGTPSGSPDKGAPDQRITPGGDRPAAPAPATVKPEDKPGAKKPAKAAPKSAAKGGSR